MGSGKGEAGREEAVLSRERLGAGVERSRGVPSRPLREKLKQASTPPSTLPLPTEAVSSNVYEAHGLWEVAISSRNTEGRPSPHGLAGGQFSWHLK